MSHSRYATVRERGRAAGSTEPAEVAEARREVRMSMALAKAVYDRRTELGLTQRALAARAGLTAPEVSRIEGSDAMPGLAQLARLAGALDATLSIASPPDGGVRVSFAARRGTATS